MIFRNEVQELKTSATGASYAKNDDETDTDDLKIVLRRLLTELKFYDEVSSFSDNG